MKYYTKTGISGGGIRDASTSELSNLKTGTFESGITGSFPKNHFLIQNFK
jgi:hypothetical protein